MESVGGVKFGVDIDLFDVKLVEKRSIKKVHLWPIKEFILVKNLINVTLVVSRSKLKAIL